MIGGGNPGAAAAEAAGPERQRQLIQALTEAGGQYRAGNLAKAKAMYRDICRQDSDNAAALHFLGVIAFDEGKPAEAIALMIEAVEKNGTIPMFHGNLGEIYRKIGRLDEAVAACRRALAIHPVYPEALNTLGVALMARGEFDDAEAALRKAIEYKPDFAPAHAALADVLRARGDWDKAIRTYRRALRKDPHLLGAYLALGTTLDAAGRSGEAVEVYDKALEIAPRDPRIWSNRGVSLRNLGRGAESLDCFRKAVELRPDLAETQVNLGKALLGQKGDTAAAETCFARAAEIKPTLAEAHFGLGGCAAARADWDTAAAAYRKALEIEPRFHQARSKLGGALLAKGDYVGAQRAFAALLEAKHGSGGVSADDLLAAHPLRNLHPTRFALLDRAEQIEHLVDAALLDTAYGGLAARCRALHDELPDEGHPERRQDLSDDQTARVGGFLDRIVYLRAAPRCAPQALNADLDFAAPEEAFLGRAVPAVPVDDLLTLEALGAVQNFCRDSTVFFESDPAGFVAASLDDGLNGDLLLQIAEELRARLPRILGERPLSGLQVRRYAAEGGGEVESHDAAIAVELWITPDAANAEPGGGGLIVYDVPAPNDQSRGTPSTSEAEPETRARLRSLCESARSTRVAYRCNRAVVFPAGLPHGPERFHFAGGFANRRVGITFLFGRKESDPVAAGSG